VDPEWSPLIQFGAWTLNQSERKSVINVKRKAEHPVLWAWLELDGVDGQFSQNFVHVREDHPLDIEVRLPKPMTMNEFSKTLRIRSLYDTYAH
jgi:hypothetical protein